MVNENEKTSTILLYMNEDTTTEEINKIIYEIKNSQDIEEYKYENKEIMKKNNYLLPSDFRDKERIVLKVKQKNFKKIKDKYENNNNIFSVSYTEVV